MSLSHQNKRAFLFESLEGRSLLSAATVTPPPTGITLPFGLYPTGESAPINAVAGQQFSGEVGFFTSDEETNPQTIAITIDWGDGTTSGGTLQTVALPGGNVAPAIFGTHSYSLAGIYKVSVEANEDVGLNFDGIFGSLQSIADVAAAPGSSTDDSQGVLIPASFAQTFSGSVGSIPAPAGALPQGAAATINWGDGSTSSGKAVLQSDGSYQIIGSHNYQPSSYRQGTNSLYAVETTVPTGGGDNFSVITTLDSVVELGDTLTYGVVNSVAAGEEFSGSVGHFAGSLWTGSPSYKAGDFLRATVDWGDGTQTKGLITPQNDGSYDIAGSHTYSQPGYYLISTSVWERQPRTGQQTVAPYVFAPAIISSAFNVVAPGASVPASIPASASPPTVAPAITSNDKYTYTIDTLGKFTVKTTGYPAPTLREIGALPSGLRFIDKGNGVGKLGGTPAPGTTGTYDITIIARNGVSPRTKQTFTVTVQPNRSAASAAPANRAYELDFSAGNAVDAIILSSRGDDSVLGG